MAKKTGLGQQLYVQGYDISGDVGQINRLNFGPRTTLPATGINKSANERLIGTTDGMIDFTAYFNDVAEAVFDLLDNLPRTDVFAIWAQGEAVGDVAAILQAKQANFDLDRPGDGSLTLQAVLLGSGAPLEDALMLTSGKDTHANATSSASKNDGASSANGLSAILNIFDIDSGTPTFIIEDSPNDSTWATLKAFAAVASGVEPTGERVTVSGTVDQYLRVTSTGTFTNADHAIAYRRGTANDIPGLI